MSLKLQFNSLIIYIFITKPIETSLITLIVIVII